MTRLQVMPDTKAEVAALLPIAEADNRTGCCGVAPAARWRIYLVWTPGLDSKCNLEWADPTDDQFIQADGNQE